MLRLCAGGIGGRGGAGQPQAAWGQAAGCGACSGCCSCCPAAVPRWAGASSATLILYGWQQETCSTYQAAPVRCMLSVEAEATPAVPTQVPTHSRLSRVCCCAGETSFDIEAVGEDGAGFVWLPQDSLPHSSLAFELPLEEEHDEASSDADSAVSTAETADLTIVDPEVCFLQLASQRSIRWGRGGVQSGRPSMAVKRETGRIVHVTGQRMLLLCSGLSKALCFCFGGAPSPDSRL